MEKKGYDIAVWTVKSEPDRKNNLKKKSAADYFQVRSLSQERLIKRIGTLDPATMAEIARGLSKVLKI